MTAACDPTCLGVSSSVADVMKRSHGNAFVLISIQPELCLRLVAILHKRHLFGKKTVNDQRLQSKEGL